MDTDRIILGTLAAWRITHLFQAEDGPWGMVVWLRRRAGRGIWGELLDCFLCLSLWIALPLSLALGSDWPERALLWPALSAGAIIVERFTCRDPVPAPAEYTEHPGTKGEM